MFREFSCAAESVDAGGQHFVTNGVLAKACASAGKGAHASP